MTARRSGRLPPAAVRFAGAAALLAGVALVPFLLPEREVPWGRVAELTLSLEDCVERREEREEARFTLPASYPDAVSWRQVAVWFRLDETEVCRANGVAPAECSGRTLAPGEGLDLPLRHHAPGPPVRVRGEGRPGP